MNVRMPKPSVIIDVEKIHGKENVKTIVFDKPKRETPAQSAKVKKEPEPEPVAPKSETQEQSAKPKREKVKKEVKPEPIRETPAQSAKVKKEVKPEPERETPAPSAKPKTTLVRQTTEKTEPVVSKRPVKGSEEAKAWGKMMAEKRKARKLEPVELDEVDE
jgi:hypothetical protein